MIIKISEDVMQRVCKLWFSGLSTFEIHKQTELEIGEIKKIIGLDKMNRIDDGFQEM